MEGLRIALEELKAALKGTTPCRLARWAVVKLQRLLDRFGLERRPSAPCADCGMRYGGLDWVEAVIPNDIWWKISPRSDGNGILCIHCMARRLRKRGYDKVPVWLVGMEPFEAKEGEPPARWA